MAPPCHVFNASELGLKVQEDVKGRRRKLKDGDRRIDLSVCELLEMLQYKCEVQRPLTRESPVQCFAVDRLFRKCKDRKGTFTIETTAWEGRHASTNNHSQKADSKSSKPYQWSDSWNHPDSPPSSSPSPA